MYIQLILIMLVGTDDCVCVVFAWEETAVPGDNPPVWLGDLGRKLEYTEKKPPIWLGDHMASLHATSGIEPIEYCDI